MEWWRRGNPAGPTDRAALGSGGYRLHGVRLRPNPPLGTLGHSITPPLNHSITRPLHHFPSRHLVHDRGAAHGGGCGVVADLDRDAGPAHVGKLAARLVVVGTVVRPQRRQGRYPPPRAGDG